MSTATFFVAASPFAPSMPVRSAVNAGPTCFITLLSAMSSVVIGGSGFFARSVNFSSMTEVAISTGRPVYFATASGARSSL